MRFGAYEITRLGSGDYDDLSVGDADRLAEVAAHDLNRSLAAVVAQIGEPDQERPERSLQLVAEWFLDRLDARHRSPRFGLRWRRLPRPVPATGGPWHPGWGDVDRTTLPFWCWFRPGSEIWGVLGPEVSVDVQIVTAYVGQLVLDAHPEATVAQSSGSRSSIDFRQPVIALGDGREYVLGARYDVMARRAVDRSDPFHGAARDVGDFVRRHLGWTRPHVPVDASSPRRFEIDDLGEPGYLVTVDDVTAHERSGAVDDWVAALASCDDIEAAHREDRDVVIVVAPGLTIEQLDRRLWDRWNGLAP